MRRTTFKALSWPGGLESWIQDAADKIKNIDQNEWWWMKIKHAVNQQMIDPPVVYRFLGWEKLLGTLRKNFGIFEAQTLTLRRFLRSPHVSSISIHLTHVTLLLEQTCHKQNPHIVSLPSLTAVTDLPVSAVRYIGTEQVSAPRRDVNNILLRTESFHIYTRDALCHREVLTCSLTRNLSVISLRLFM